MVARTRNDSLAIELARKRAGEAGVADRTSFEVASAAAFPGSDYDLAATFDCLHDMGDPLAAARHIRETLKPDGTWLVVEPYAADDAAGNMSPVGRRFHQVPARHRVALQHRVRGAALSSGDVLTWPSKDPGSSRPADTLRSCRSPPRARRC